MKTFVFKGGRAPQGYPGIQGHLPKGRLDQDLGERLGQLGSVWEGCCRLRRQRIGTQVDTGGDGLGERPRSLEDRGLCGRML